MPAMSASRILRPFFKMQIEDWPFKTRSSKSSFRLSRTDSTKHEVCPVICPSHIRFNEFLFCAAQKASSSSPINFGRIAKPLRGGGGAAPTAAPPPVAGFAGSVNPLARVQSEETG